MYEHVPVCQYFGLSFSLPSSSHDHVCKVLTYSNRYFGAMSPRVYVKLMESGTILMENFSKVDVINALPQREFTEDIMEVELQIIYPDHYSIPVLPAINIYISHLMNKKCTREIIELGDQKYSSGRRVHKSLYRKKYYDQLNTCFGKNRVGFKSFPK